jgi:hypothetical protein
MSNEVFISIVRQFTAKLVSKVPHAVQAISVGVAPDGGTKIAAEHHTETSRCPISI